ncbi:MAG: hypothetical protein J5725_04305 [Bacteroidales bacterium]|nr:hypothetical protein [Bacteroidales bacterium]
MDMYDFRLFVRECLKTGKADEMIKILIEEDILPPIPQGEWIRTDGNSFECPFCHRLFDFGDNYCGFCGASMKKGGAKE